MEVENSRANPAAWAVPEHDAPFEEYRSCEVPQKLFDIILKCVDGDIEVMFYPTNHGMEIRLRKLVGKSYYAVSRVLGHREISEEELIIHLIENMVLHLKRECPDAP